MSDRVYDLLRDARVHLRELKQEGTHLDISVLSQHSDGHTALTLAVAEDSLRLARTLIAARSNVNVSTRSGLTALHFACQHENVDMTRLLLESNAIPLCHDSTTKTTPLHIAATKGNAELCELLLTYGADMNAVDKDGWTPIFWAVQQDHKHLVKTMISYGDDETVNKLLAHRDKRGWRPPLFERAVLLEHLASIDMNTEVDASEDLGEQGIAQTIRRLQTGLK